MKYYYLKNIDKNLVKEVLLKGGRTLFSAGVGVGKTYNFINVCKEINDEKEKYIILFVTPTRTLSEQNGKQYNCHTVVSGVNHIMTSVVLGGFGRKPKNLITEGVNVVVYDKLNLVTDNIDKYNDYKIILIVDEAHELIYAKNYRNMTLERIKQLEKIAFKTVHLTATPTVNEVAYNYDEIIEVAENQTIKEVNIIEVEKNKENEKGRSIEKALIYKIVECLENNRKALIQYNSHEGIDRIISSTKKLFPHKKLVSMTSENKTSEEFNYLIQNNKINEDIDLILSTSILNTGINIKNNDIELIYVANNNINLDSIKQFAGRTRNNNTSFTILKHIGNGKTRYNQEFKDKLKFEYEKSLKEAIRKKGILENFIVDMEESVTEEKSIESGIAYIKNYKNNGGINASIIFDEEKFKIIIDKEILMQVVLNKLYNEYNNLPKLDLEKLLKDTLKSDNVTFIKTKENEKGKIINKNIIESRKNKFLDKKEFREKFVQEFKELKNPHELIEILESKFLNEEKSILDALINSKTQEIRKLYNELIENEEGKKILEEIKKIYKLYRTIFKNCIEEFIRNNLNSKYFRAPLYKSFNRAFKDLNKLSEEDKKKYFELKDMYLNIRLTLDNKVQKRLSKNDILSIHNIIVKKKVKTFKDLTKQQQNKAIKEIKLIYKIKQDKEGIKITSLIK